MTPTALALVPVPCSAAGDVPFSFTVLGALIVIVAASSTMYWMLVRRATARRQWVALAEWSRANGFRLARADDLSAPPAPFDALPSDRQPPPRLRLSKDDTHTFLQLSRAPADAPTSSPADPRESALRPPPAWNLLIVRLESEWPPTGLRALSIDPTPDTAARGDRDASLVELFALPAHPLMRGGGGRFVLHGADSVAARRLSRSSVPNLLPPDVGLLVRGRRLVLDFSARPFDPLQFMRMLTVADQLVAHLPPLRAGSGSPM